MSSSSSSSRSRTPKRNKKRVYVTGYSLKEDQHDIKKAFKKYGKIEEFAWKGKYCFIEFKSADDAQKAVKKLNREDFNGSTLQVELAKGSKPSRNNGMCYSCGRQGHFAKNCRHRQRSPSSSSSSSSVSRKKHKKKNKKKKRSSSSSASESSSSSPDRRTKKKSKKKEKKSASKEQSKSKDSKKSKSSVSNDDKLKKTEAVDEENGQKKEKE